MVMQIKLIVVVVVDLLPKSLNLFFKEMYGDQFGEFVCGYWDLKG